MVNPIETIFSSVEVDGEVLNEFNNKAEPPTKYIIAMTPRSGSSYLCDVMRQTNCLGRPGESLAHQFIPKILTRVPARSPDEYLLNIFKNAPSKNGVSGIKASWFQFNIFSKSLKSKSDELFDDVKFIYLYRRDAVAQAISLYRATETRIFHTNIRHSDESKKHLDMLEYDFHKIKKWLEHIQAQEIGWKKYFLRHNIFPLCITYEDISSDIHGVINMIAGYLKIKNKNLFKNEIVSEFERLSTRKSVEWTARFNLDLDALQREGLD